MTPTAADINLNKAALVIVKLLILTREGKIAWVPNELAHSAGLHIYRAQLENGVEAVLYRDSEQFNFALEIPAVIGKEKNDLHEFAFGNKILSISLKHTFGCPQEEELSPESIVYGDLEKLYEFAKNPQTISEDLKLKQVLTYLDRLAG